MLGVRGLIGQLSHFFQHGSVTFTEVLLHERGQEDAASHVHVLFDVQSFSWHVHTQFSRLLSLLAGLAPTHAPSFAQLQSGRCIDMCLYTIGQIVEAGFVRDLAGPEAAREVVDLVGDLVPRAVVFVLWCMRRGCASS